MEGHRGGLRDLLEFELSISTAGVRSGNNAWTGTRHTTQSVHPDGVERDLRRFGSVHVRESTLLPRVGTAKECAERGHERQARTRLQFSQPVHGVERDRGRFRHLFFVVDGRYQLAAAAKCPWNRYEP